jgi:hypothetical protein
MAALSRSKTKPKASCAYVSARDGTMAFAAGFRLCRETNAFVESFQSQGSSRTKISFEHWSVKRRHFVNAVAHLAAEGANERCAA